MLLQLHKSFVHLILEYENSYCMGTCYVPMFVKIQRRATKLVREIKDLLYVDRLHNIDALEVT